MHIPNRAGVCGRRDATSWAIVTWKMWQKSKNTEVIFIGKRISRVIWIYKGVYFTRTPYLKYTDPNTQQSEDPSSSPKSLLDIVPPQPNQQGNNYLSDNHIHFFT